MKKILFPILIAAAALAGPLALYAAGSAAFSLSPATGSFASGTEKTLSIYVDPSGSPIYTAKVDLGFSASTLEVISFAPAAGTIPLVQPGYDSIDNTAGTLIKTVGFPGGVSKRALVGSLVVEARQTGAATLAIRSDSLALDATNANAASSFGSAAFTLSAAVAGQEPGSGITAPSTTSTATVAVGAKSLSTALLTILIALGAVILMALSFLAGKKWGAKK